jgi:Zn-finger nucleic acid-binding protein
MTCPRCTGDLVERDRTGVTIDICAGCRGVWLDRGELEKLIQRSSAAADDDDDDHDDDDGARRGDRRGGRRWWDIFD